MIVKDDYIDGEKFEAIADIGFGDKYTKELPLDFNRLNNFIINFKKDRLPIVYVDSARVKNFFNIIKDYEKPFILLSHNGDIGFNQSDIDNCPKCIKKWFGQNINAINTDSIISLPIGLERPHWSKHRYGIHSHKHNKIYEYSKKECGKNKMCYINFNPKTSKSKRQWIVPHFTNKKWVFIRMGGISGNIDHYFKDCKESHFVICPDGNGIDCHRNWEMLYIGVTPIIERSYFHEKIYGDLPVLIVDSFKDLNENLLLEKLDSFKKNNNTEKLKFSYWENIIKR
jgi:hypothetical protein